ncbi:hypothetical protein QUB17_28425 [Microcoleus sp. B5-C4]
MLTEIGSDDFGKHEGRSPKIKKAPKKPQKLLQHLNPTAHSARRKSRHTRAGASTDHDRSSFSKRGGTLALRYQKDVALWFPPAQPSGEARTPVSFGSNWI